MHPPGFAWGMGFARPGCGFGALRGSLEGLEHREQARGGALAEYPGALLLVTHDDAFAAWVTSETWTLDPSEAS